MRMRYGRKDKMKKTEYAKKITVIIIGAIISAFGISIAINAGFGGATLAVLWQGTAKCLNMSIGTASAVVAAVMILFAFFYDRKQIHIGSLLQVCRISIHQLWYFHCLSTVLQIYLYYYAL